MFFLCYFPQFSDFLFSVRFTRIFKQINQKLCSKSNLFSFINDDFSRQLPAIVRYTMVFDHFVREFHTVAWIAYSFHQRHFLLNHCVAFPISFFLSLCTCEHRVYSVQRFVCFIIFVIACTNFSIRISNSMFTTSSLESVSWVFVNVWAFFTAPSPNRANLISYQIFNVFIWFLCALFIMFFVFLLSFDCSTFYYNFIVPSSFCTHAAMCWMQNCTEYQTAIIIYSCVNVLYAMLLDAHFLSRLAYKGKHTRLDCDRNVGKCIKSEDAVASCTRRIQIE